ncbi:hypothetical protein [Streptomyces sp. RTd22]|uniref:hypothetical protein n=1 Tax=Streptomyces sp. RTd22 TaxID=1841249 RepID=UPI0007C48D41|nr:hypothetical protein [Streptomyces sp. RTd22]
MKFGFGKTSNRGHEVEEVPGYSIRDGMAHVSGTRYGVSDDPSGATFKDRQEAEKYRDHVAEKERKRQADADWFHFRHHGG